MVHGHTKVCPKFSLIQMQQEMATKVNNMQALENENLQLRVANDGRPEQYHGELTWALKRDQEAKAHIERQMEQEERLNKAMQ